MRKNFGLIVLAMAIAAGCSQKRSDVEQLAPGSEVTVKQTDGPALTGKVIEVKPDVIVLQPKDGPARHVPRKTIASVAVQKNAATATDASASATRDNKATDSGPERSEKVIANANARREPEYREVTIPAGTVLPLSLETRVASDTSHAEDPVRARLERPLTVEGITAVPSGSMVTGTVTEARRAGKVKGRAQIGIRFDALSAGNDRYTIRTGGVSRVARSTKKKDAMEIGIPAAGGAVLGGIFGGKKGAAIGGAAGGGAGTAYVLSTRGEEVRLDRGATISVKLLEPLKVRVRKG